MGRAESSREVSSRSRSKDDVGTNLDKSLDVIIEGLYKDCRSVKERPAVRLLVNLHYYLQQNEITVDEGFVFKDDDEMKRFEDEFWPNGSLNSNYHWMYSTFKLFRDTLKDMGFEHNHQKKEKRLIWKNKLFKKDGPDVRGLLQLRRTLLKEKAEKTAGKTSTSVLSTEETGGNEDDAAANDEKDEPQSTPASILGLVQRTLAVVESRSKSMSNTMTKELEDQLKDLSETNERVSELGKLLEVEQLPSGYLVSQAIECMLMKTINRWAPRLEVREAVIEVSGPCLGLPMAAGQLRSAVYLDVLVRMLKYAGVEVIGKSLVEDNGVRFGMLMEHHIEISRDSELAELTSMGGLEEPFNLEAFHDAAQAKLIEGAGGFRSRAKAALNLLNNKDSKYTDAYSQICNMSRVEYKKIYERIGLMSPDETCVSTHDEHIQDVMMNLTGKEIIRKSTVTTGNQVIRGESDGMEVNIMSSDGEYSKHATFLSALCKHLKEKKDAWTVYVTDAGESETFQMLLNAAKIATSDPEDDYNPKITHMGIGDFVGNPSTEVIGLINTVKTRCTEMLTFANAAGKNLSEDVVEKLAERISIGALKYADLKNDRDQSYTFSLDEMLSQQGNSVYTILSAHASISRVIRMYGTDSLKHAKESGRIMLLQEAELTLGRHLASFTQVVESACLALKPHFVCDYVYLLSQHYRIFSLACPVSDSTLEVDYNRLLLCEATKQVFEKCLYLLGINSVVDICSNF